MWGRAKTIVAAPAPEPSVDELAPLPEDVYADVDSQNIEIQTLQARIAGQAASVRDIVDSMGGHLVRNHFSETAIQSMRIIDSRSAS